MLIDRTTVRRVREFAGDRAIEAAHAVAINSDAHAKWIMECHRCRGPVGPSGARALYPYRRSYGAASRYPRTIRFMDSQFAGRRIRRDVPGYVPRWTVRPRMRGLRYVILFPISESRIPLRKPWSILKALAYLSAQEKA